MILVVVVLLVVLVVHVVLVVLLVLVLVVLVLVVVEVRTKTVALKIFGGFIFTFNEHLMSFIEIITLGILSPFGDFPLHLNVDLFNKISKQITKR